MKERDIKREAASVLQKPEPEEEQEIIRLLPKRKKGFLGILFSRVGIVLILMLLEIALLWSVYHWFHDYFAWFTVVQTGFSVGMVLYLFNCDMDYSAKLTWLNLIMLFPVPTTIFLWYSKKDIGHRAVKRRIALLIEQTGGILQQDTETLQSPVLQNSGTDDLCRYLNHSGHFPIYQNTQVIYFPLGENKFEALLEDLEKAEKFIFMEYFILDEGYMWGRILSILKQKAAQGVDVRVMYDGMCEIALLSHDYPQRMAKFGIKCKPFMPITPFLSTQYNYRDHRKILVIDGKVAYNGGVNLADEYINRKKVYGHWKDTAVRLSGEAVQSFTLMFLQMWNIDEREPDWQQARIAFREEGSGFVMPYGDCPLDGDKVGESVYMDILYRAKDYVYIMTPYLILDNELETALKYAAQRGVEVKIILPGIPDKLVPYALAKSHYKSLMKAGVQIYEYDPGFVHAKVFVSDDEKAVVGTINLDYRSLYHHFECATYLYKTDCIGQIREDYLQTLQACRLVTLEMVKKEKRSIKMLGGFMKVFAPLM